ncbi:chromate transporter [Fusobacterium sp. PH5-44]|uniref:chromate transporter n=1 Tax=unclassified Fusobacterium TaxID=2648384 RepID=UPI003D1A00E8
MNKINLILLISFLKIGLFSIGGGYATIPLIEEQIININKWLTIEEFTDIITISQMTPGPLAVNLSTFVGMRISGIFGAVIATFSCIISGFSISIFLYCFFEKYKNLEIIFTVLKGLRSISVGLICGSACTMFFMAMKIINNSVASDSITIKSILIFTACILLLKKFRGSPIVILVLSGIAGLII